MPADDAYILRTPGIRRELRGQLPDHVEQLRCVGRINLVPRVAGLVIIAVQSGEEKQDRDLLRCERSVIARTVATLLAVIELERIALLQLVESSGECRPRSGAADKDLPVPN